VIRPEILVAESEERTARFLRAALESAEYQVLQATDGDAAMKILRTRKPALVLIAANLPGLSSRQILLRVRADSRLSNLPVILLGDPDSAEESVEWLMLGADDYISKPVSARLLIALVHAKIRRSEKYQAVDENSGVPALKVAHTGMA
jgi:two-component system, OmpR family, phosphate regulon response regulator PhoB